VSEADGARIWIFDALLSQTATLDLGADFRTGERMHSITLLADGSSLLVLSADSATRLRLVRRADGSILHSLDVAGQPRATPAIDPRSRHLAVGVGGRLLLIDRDRLTVDRDIPICGRDVRDLVLFPEGGRLFAACGDSLAEIDLPLQTMVRAVTSPCATRGAALSANGTQLYLACPNGRLYSLDRVTLRTVDSLVLSAVPNGLTTLDGRALWVWSGDSNLVYLELREQGATVWTTSGRTVTALAVGDGELLALTTSPEGDYLVSTGPGGQGRRAPLPGRAAQLTAWPLHSPVMRWSPR
jgi:hypothetical protein